MSTNTNESVLDFFIFESLQLIEHLEAHILNGEQSSGFEPATINEIFRIMHTIKGSAAMMQFKSITETAHAMEDVFYFLREENPQVVNYVSLTDIVLEAIDFIKNDIIKLQNGNDLDGDNSQLLQAIRSFLLSLKQLTLKQSTTTSFDHSSSQSTHSNHDEQTLYFNNAVPNRDKFQYKALIYFAEDCEMENIRAFSIVHHLKAVADIIRMDPPDIMENEESAVLIRLEGFKLWFQSKQSIEEMRSILWDTLFIKDILLESADILEKKEIVLDDNLALPDMTFKAQEKEKEKEKEWTPSSASKQTVINVSVSKLDSLMDLVGELVISEAMVTQNPDLVGLPLDSFTKAARQLKKISDEIQDVVMSLRMVSLSATFHKMNRIVRDMSKKLNRDVKLEIIGEDTEVDKNIIEHISDPLMHIIRNSIDHGIESAAERIAKGKPELGTITLEAIHAGREVWIIIKDDGKGLDREKILNKAKALGLINRPEHELSDRDIFSCIFLPGFSTNEQVTEFSGRGVGMDVATKNIQMLGGMISVDSKPDRGTVVSLKIPLTLAIIDGMTIRVGDSSYTLPTVSIRESFRTKEGDIIRDPDGNEMILVRGQCHQVIRLHQLFNVFTKIERIHEGIILMVENDLKCVCVFADGLVGKQQVVVKSLPTYIKKSKGVAGCTLLGDGSISLILDIAGLFDY